MADMDDNFFRFVNVNTRRLTTVNDIGSRIDHINQFLAIEKKCDIIACTETHLDDTVDEHSISIDGFSLIRKDRE